MRPYHGDIAFGRNRITLNKFPIIKHVVAISATRRNYVSRDFSKPEERTTYDKFEANLSISFVTKQGQPAFLESPQRLVNEGNINPSPRPYWDLNKTVLS